MLLENREASAGSSPFMEPSDRFYFYSFGIGVIARLEKAR